MHAKLVVFESVPMGKIERVHGLDGAGSLGNNPGCILLRDVVVVDKLIEVSTRAKVHQLFFFIKQ